MPRVPITMPQLGESIAEGTVVSVLFEAGSPVKADVEIIEVETQKATMGITAVCPGTIAEVLAEEGETYPVGHVLGYLEASEEDMDAYGLSPAPEQAPADETDEDGSDGPKNSRDNDRAHFATDGEAEGDAEATAARVGVSPNVQGLPVPASAAGASYISPRLRARMTDLGLTAADLSAVAGTGGAGRVTVQDLERFLTDIEQKKIANATPMRVAVADSMRRSWQRPLATVGIPVALENLLAHRKQQDAPKPGPALYALRALALALADRQEYGGFLLGRRIILPDSIDIGFAVEVPDGVMVPVLRNANERNLAELTAEYGELVEKARAKSLSADESKPGVATVTNFGTFGIEWATPIPLPEQNLVLGLGAGSKRPVWDDESGSFKPVVQAELTLSFDHRVLDGGHAGRLLQRIAELMNSPEQL
ncbi:dihydrolipoamide acetyltransferase family protein [Sulfuriroseicoccus oceanibius]|uniref:Dihydrolipoamide acetyltransferase component of pyruvate dehydrogenase complex n=1 Tax=Sulfuriroseicoccus oceanibius TaxID=2707525 RepID=A0A6B3L9I2_9BACT|nr:dihydrolipoamide acetyltransferase family protein [Sulfuriroseicoccus oceanibius]QQL44046.1 2-oxo acid dehydrogenase subunit E2 [Sulfuriroseicoccus oceanibius]